MRPVQLKAHANPLNAGFMEELPMNKRSFRFVCLLALLVIRQSESQAQWVQTAGPYGGYVQAFAVSGTNLFAGTGGGGVFLSENNGTSWTAVNSGLTNMNILSFAVIGTNLFAGTYKGGVFVSDNDGASWTPVNTGLTSMEIRSLMVRGTDLYAGTYGGGAFVSPNNGAHWTAVNSGLTDLNVRSFTVMGTKLFAGTRAGGVFVSENNGRTWTAVNSGLTNMNVRSFAAIGTDLFAGTADGVFMTDNNGIHWTAVHSDMANTNVLSLAVSGGHLFAGTSGGGVLVTENKGTSWTEANTGLTHSEVLSLAVCGTRLFAGTGGGGVFVSDNNGEDWSETNTGLLNIFVRCFLMTENKLFAGTEGSGVFLSDDNGASWTAVNNGLANRDVLCFVVSGHKLFAGTNGGGLFVTENDGANWNDASPDLWFMNIYSLKASGTRLFAGTWNSGVFVSDNNGTSWTEANSGLTDMTVNAFAVMGTRLFAGTGGGVFVSENNGTSWTPASSGLTNTVVLSLAVMGTRLFAGTNGGVFVSDINGTNWTPVNSGLTNTVISYLAVDGTRLFAGTYGGGVFVLNDNGVYWGEVSQGLADLRVFALAVSGTTLYAAIYGNGIWRRPLSEMTAPEVRGLTVTNTGDSGPGSFRQAILDANANPGIDTIRFAIPENDPGFRGDEGVWTIRPISGFPKITDGNLVIDGFSQAVSVGREPNPLGPEIEIDGSLTTDWYGLWIAAPNTELYGLIVNRFDLPGIEIADGDGGRISGCYIGSDATGMKPAGNGSDGIHFIRNTRDFRIVPYEDILPGNIVSGNSASGILLNQTCSRILISGNAIGLNRECDRALGNSLQGINIASGCDSNEVTGNWIGGNGTEGVYCSGSHMNAVSNNLIGTDDDFVLELGNLGNGVELSASGDNTLSGNVIWHNGNDGIRLGGASSKHNRIAQNSIWRNKNKGINNLFGANEGLAPPVIQSIASDEVTGNTGAGQTVEIFTDDAGQGKFHLGSVISNTAGEFRFSLLGQDLLSYITATTIDASGNTSEFCSAVKTDVQEKTEEKLPREFALRQNYPNPFNPSTTIQFSVKEPFRVTLKVYDIRGKEVAVLADAKYQPGRYTVRFDASGLPSGIYMYGIQMGEFKAARKMIILE
jgi:photosystem II stability/assembly factor-like uncharacterized protein